ncbi:phosphoribosyltransferase [Phosphitispora fastidiosa]|uniref:phosphoribosyltransferase n=1 Tax=Phosphitispora fastidiosa TaxID=2837202 RepID=UPI001E500DB9|nr:putative phosphoribosyltransferase [Phosphitispora fastidiosa]
MLFLDRKDAGIKLASVLKKYLGENVIVLGIPRGGIVVAAEAAQVLEAPMDVIIPRKIGAPHNPEVAIGAVAPDGTIITDDYMLRVLEVSQKQAENLAASVSEEIHRRESVYRKGRSAHDLQGKTVIVVDDGIATGFTVKAALKSLRKAVPSRLVLAVPVMPADTAGVLKEMVDDLVCLHIAENFSAVGQFYRDFTQTTDDEVIQLLEENNGKTKTGSS